MFRSIFLVILGVAITGFMSAFAITIAFFSPGEHKVHKVASIWAKMMLTLANTKVRVIGGENIIWGRPYIYMANHQSDFDIFIVLAHIPGRFRWVAKKELFRIPLFGAAMRRAGYIEINRQHHERALKSLDEAAKKIREGTSVMTFPEGTRSKDGIIKPFKQGMFYLAIQSGVPIIPVSIIGSGDIMRKRSLRIYPGKITLFIDRPIAVSGYSIEDRHLLIEKVRNVIIGNYDKYKSVPEADGMTTREGAC
jgi:1-acyl-sn-glycerol-3-phosphate acyltransferase